MCSLSQEIALLRSEFADDRPRIMTVAEGQRLAERLLHLQRLAASIERELAVHRLAEASRSIGRATEQEASRVLRALVEDPEGKIIHHDFRRDT